MVVNLNTEQFRIWVISLKPSNGIVFLSNPRASSSYRLIFSKSVKANYLSSRIYGSSVYHKHIYYEKLKKTSELCALYCERKDFE